MITEGFSTFLMNINFFTSRMLQKFIFFGGIAAAINFLSRIVLSLKLNFTLSIFIAHFIGMFCAYFLFKNFVFRSKNSKFQSLRFVTVNIFSLLIVLFVSLVFANKILPAVGISIFKHEIAHFIALSCTVFSSFILHKFWTFS